MGKRKKKLTEGQASNYLTRTRALKKLQLSLKDFRRLCILKGIYPRPPKKRLVKKYGTKTTFYHVKDVLFLNHEPLLKKFREMKIYLRKLNKAKNREDKVRHAQLKAKKPKFVFDHLIRERYPSFLDALQDLDDPLSMIHLFASLPSGMTKDFSGRRMTKIQQLRDEFQQWMTKAGCLRKAFVSIKGTYFQVMIHQQPVIFVVPHKFVHQTPADVDYNVMATFLDFYETLVKFVNFRLYKEAGLHYPPLVDQKLDKLGLGFLRLKPETIEQAENRENSDAPKPAEKPKEIANLDNILSKVQNDEPMEEEEKEAESDAKEEKEKDPEDRGELFVGLHFLLNRETPQDNLELLVLACGGHCTRVQYCKQKDDPNFTHHVVDRPMKEDTFLPSREYIQPQWLFDSLNANTLLPTRPFRPNVAPPPHLSPFVDNEKEAYVPKQALVTESWKQGKVVEEEEEVQGKEKEEAKFLSDDEEEKSEEEGRPDEKTMKDLQKSMITGKRRHLLKAMKMGNAKRTAFTENLSRKRRKLNPPGDS